MCVYEILSEIKKDFFYLKLSESVEKEELPIKYVPPEDLAQPKMSSAEDNNSNKRFMYIEKIDKRYRQQVKQQHQFRKS